VVQETGELLHVTAEVHALAKAAVGEAAGAFAQMAKISDAAITAFFADFAQCLAVRRQLGGPIAEANAADVESARERGRPTGRLAGHRQDARRDDRWAARMARRPTLAGPVVEQIEHRGWSVEQLTRAAGGGGVRIRGPAERVRRCSRGAAGRQHGLVFRIGSDALGTAQAMVSHALAPALAAAGLPAGACVLLESPERAAGWALFSDPRLALAVARGSGRAVAQLGAVARQAGVRRSSLHGTAAPGWCATGRADTSGSPRR